MRYVLVTTGDEETRRIPLTGDSTVVGSAPSCDAVLRDPSVSRRHARLRIVEDGVLVEDLGSRNGTRIRGRRVNSEVVPPGVMLRFGRVVCMIEKVSRDDVELGVDFGTGTGPRGSDGEAPETAVTGAGEQLVLEVLPRLVAGREDLTEAHGLARELAAAVHRLLPVTGVTLVVPGEKDGTAVLFCAVREGAPDGGRAGFPVGDLRLEVVFPGPVPPPPLIRLLDALCRLVPVPPDTTAADRIWAAPPPLPEPPTVDPGMSGIYRTAARVAQAELPVLICGESGTGKEVLARYIHAASVKARGPFHALNCAALPADLLEAELFGIERGVATGVEARPGWFERAEGGTLLLDEIGDMALTTQAKILRVLQSGEVYRLGARVPRKVGVRVLAATNQDLESSMARGRFRTDLYHRLAGWEVTIPPLRDRPADIPNLAAFFLERAAARCGVRVRGITRAALGAMKAYPWPGNVRELEREMERAALFLADGEALDTTRLDERIVRTAGEGCGGGRLAAVIERVERREILSALAAEPTAGAAARRLGISRATLYRRMKALGIEPGTGTA